MGSEAEEKGRNDFIGQQGESIFRTEILRFGENGLPYFNPIFLGEKKQTFDFLVEAVGFESRNPDDSVQPYLFVQVKATTLGYTQNKRRPRLKVRLSALSIERIKRYPAPAYLVGVDIVRERSFVVAIDARIEGEISSISTINPLNNPSVLKRLRDEVRGHWLRNNVRMAESSFPN